MTDTTTPTRPDALRTLADRVERGESGKAIDRQIAVLNGWFRVEPRHRLTGKRGGWIAPEDFLGAGPDGRPILDGLHGTTIHADVPAYTTSLDATEALREAALPGSWVYAIQQNARLSGLGWRWTCELITRGGEHAVLGEAPTEPAARLSALLRALAAEMEGRS